MVMMLSSGRLLQADLDDDLLCYLRMKKISMEDVMTDVALVARVRIGIQTMFGD